MQPRRIAFFGKSGVGTTSVATNVAASLAEMGRRVTMVGGGPRGDSTVSLRGGRELQTLHSALVAASSARPEVLAIDGFKGVRLLEIGAPAVGGCSGRTFGEALALASRLRLLEECPADFILFDFPADAVCDGLTTILASGLIDLAVAVTTADFASLRAVNDLLGALASSPGKSLPRLAGLVGNDLTGPFAEAVIGDFATATGIELLTTVPRSAVAMQSDLLGETVIEAAPLAIHAYKYRRLARKLAVLDRGRRPRPLESQDLKSWAAGWAERIYELDGGFLHTGEAI